MLAVRPSQQSCGDWEIGRCPMNMSRNILFAWHIAFQKQKKSVYFFLVGWNGINLKYIANGGIKLMAGIYDSVYFAMRIYYARSISQ